MNARSILRCLIAVASLSLAAQGQDGVEGVLARVGVAAALNLDSPFDRTLAVADFDDDQKPDGALLVRDRASGVNRFHIELHLSRSRNNILPFESPGGSLSITTADVNQDGKLDVIVERSLTHKRLYVWLNDGKGNFHQGRVEDSSNDSQLGDSLVLPSCPSPLSAFCLPQQRESDTLILGPTFLRGRPPSANEFPHPRYVSTLPFGTSLVNPSRAPPLSRS